MQVNKKAQNRLGESRFNKNSVKNRLKRGVTMVEVVIAMAIIGVMIAVAVSASVIGLNGETSSTYRVRAASAAGEMYSAFSRTYYDDGFYSGNYTASDDTMAAAFLNAYNGEIAAGLNLSEKASFTISGGVIQDGANVTDGKYTLVMDSVTYYVNDASSGEPEAKTLYTRYIEISNGTAAYTFTYTYHVNSLDFDEDDFTYTESEVFTVTAEVDLSTGYGVKVIAELSGASGNMFEEEYSFAI